MTKNCPIILVTLFQRFRLNNETLSQAKNFIKTMDQFWNTFIKEITRKFFLIHLCIQRAHVRVIEINYWSTAFWSCRKTISKLDQNWDSILRSVFEQNIFFSCMTRSKVDQNYFRKVIFYIFRMVTSCNSDAEFLAATSDKNMIYLGWFWNKKGKKHRHVQGSFFNGHLVAFERSFHP